MLKINTRVFVRTCYTLFTTCFFSFPCFAQSNWTGAVSAEWSNSANWTPAVVPGASDNVQIGIAKFNFQPVISTTVQARNLTFGGAASVTLTVSAGAILNIAGKVVQLHSSDNNQPSSIITGLGTLNCQAVLVGDQVGPKLVQNKTTTLISTITNLNVGSNITLNSITANLLTGGIANNNSLFSLRAGNLNLGGKIILNNQLPYQCNSPVGNNPLAKFSIDINSDQNATLNLTDSSAVSVSNPVYDSVDFYNYFSGNGRSRVVYQGGNQLVYTNTSPGIDVSPYLYQDLIIGGTGIKTAGNNNNNSLTVAGNLIVSGGTLDLVSFSPQTLINGNFSNRGAIRFGNGLTSINGPVFFNSGSFSPGSGFISFSGSNQQLTDSTQTGTNFNRLIFNNAYAKTIQSGSFNVLPNGEVRLLNQASVNVAQGAGFTIQADSTGSARIAALPAGSSVTGTVNVQQFFQGSGYLHNTTARGYYMFTSPVNYTGTTTGDRYFNLNFINGTSNTTGIFTTGLSGGGFNAVGNPTLYLYREDVGTCNGSFVCGNFRGIGKINYSDPGIVGTQKRFTTANTVDTTVSIPVATGILVFIRGNKVFSNGTTTGTKTTQPYNYPENIVLTHTGVINQGDIQARDWFRQDHTLSYTNSPSIDNSGPRGSNSLGNPYPAPINLDNFSATDSTSAIYAANVGAAFYFLNRSTGQYDAYIPDATHDKTQVYYGTGVSSNILKIGQGIFVTINGSAARLTFREGAKFDPDASSVPVSSLTAVNLNSLNSIHAQSRMSVKGNSIVSINSGNQRLSAASSGGIKNSGNTTMQTSKTGSPDYQLRISLLKDENVIDDILIRFKPGSSRLFNPREDAIDIGGTDDAQGSLSSYSTDGKPLSINTLPLLKRITKIPLAASAIQSGGYSIRINRFGLPANLKIGLKDKLTGKVFGLTESNPYRFLIDKSLQNTDGDRFELIIVDQSMAAKK